MIGTEAETYRELINLLIQKMQSPESLRRIYWLAQRLIKKECD